MLIAAYLSGLSTAVIADEIEAKDTIVVTATRNQISIDDSTVPVTVIDRQQIEQSLATDLSELLRSILPR